MTDPKTILRRYTKVIDTETLQSAIPLSIIEQLYRNTSQCFPSEKEASLKQYYLRLVKFLHNDIKRVSSTSSISKSASASASASSASDVFEGPEFGFYFKMDHDETDDRWELFVMFEEQRIAASCLVHYDDTEGTAEIEEVCVAIPGKKYCKQMILKVLASIQRREKDITQVLIFCFNENIPACKCYQSVFGSEELPDIKNASWITQNKKKGQSVTRFVYTVPIQRRSPVSKKQKRS